MSAIIRSRFLLASALLAAGCKPSDHASNQKPDGADPSGKPLVYTDFYPTQYFTQRIAGNLVEVVCPVPPDEDPIFWKPDAETIGRYQKADLIVLNGAHFARWVAQATLPESRVVESAHPLEAGLITYENATVHKHGPAGEHSHEGIDGHTWVDPVNAKTQADEIRKALARTWPAHEESFATGFAALAADLDALDAGFREFAARAAETPVLASHPAYNYLARRYGWKLHNLDLDPGEMPDDGTFASVREVLSTFPAKTLVWESSPTEEIAARFQSELGVSSVVFSPCERKDPESPDDYLAVMKANLATLRAVYTP